MDSNNNVTLALEPNNNVTLASFSYESRYDSKLKEARLVGAKKGATTGGALGFIYFLFFTINGVALW